MWCKTRPPPHNHMVAQRLNHSLDEGGRIDASFSAAGDRSALPGALQRHMAMVVRKTRAKAEQGCTEPRVTRKRQASAVAIKLVAPCSILWAEPIGTHVDLQEIHVRPAKELLPSWQIPLLGVSARKSTALGNREVAPIQCAPKGVSTKVGQGITQSFFGRRLTLRVLKSASATIL